MGVFPECVFVFHMHEMSVVAKIGSWIPWSKRWLWAAVRLLITEERSSGGAPTPLTSELSLELPKLFLKHSFNHCNPFLGRDVYITKVLVKKIMHELTGNKIGICMYLAVQHQMQLTNSYRWKYFGIFKEVKYTLRFTL